MNIEQYKQDNPYWWSVGQGTKAYSCSDYLINLCGMDPKDINAHNFVMLVNPIHQNRVEDVINGVDVSEVRFELLTKFGYRWAKLKRSKDASIGCVEFQTEVQCAEISDDDNAMFQYESIDRYTKVSNILTELHYQKDVSIVINKILKSLLETFKCDRAYLFEYNMDEKVQNCTYEVVAPGVSPSIENLQNIPISETQWLYSTITENSKAFICDDIENLPATAASEYEILKKQGICSLIIMPFMNKDKVVGYIGIDIVDRKYSWSNTDKLWFQSLSNLISMCIALKQSERKAKIERERYRDLYDNMPVGLIKLKLVYDEKGKVIDYIVLEMNHITCSLFNVKIEDVRGLYGSTQIDNPFFKSSLSKFEDIIKTRKVVNKGLNIDYLNRYLNYTIFPVDSDDILILFQDNTEKIETSRALRKSEETLEHIYNNIPIGVEIYDKDGILVSLNDVEQDMFGYQSKEDVLGISLFDNPNVPQSFLDDLKNGKSSWCDFYYDFDKLNKYYQSKCFGRKHIVLKGSVLCDSDNNIENYLLIVLDNTDTIRANHKILEFESLFNSIAEFAEIGLSQWNPKNKTIFGTDQWHENLCCHDAFTEDIMSGYCNVHEEDKAKLQKDFDDILAGRISSFRREIRVKNGDNLKWIKIHYKVSDQDDDVEIIGISVDITEMKNTEDNLRKAKLKAEEADNLKLSFLANMSHEIRTPLNAINGFSDLLVNIDDVSEREQYSKIIKQNGDVLLQLITDILDLSKIDSGMANLFIEPVDLHGVCREVIMLYKSKAAPNVRFAFEPQQDECVVMSDCKRLTQILSNIMSNAVKFTKSGSIKVGYTVTGSKVEIFIRDTGVGIKEEYQPNVFNRFVKLNDFVPGTGLGLSICQRLVELLGGNIWFESIVGIGSSFYFTQSLYGAELEVIPTEISAPIVTQAHVVASPLVIPVPVSAPVAVPVATPIVLAEQPVIKEIVKPILLIAEDTDSNYLLLSTMLKRDYTLYRAMNGKEAVDLFIKHQPAMVLMDIRMPIMDGLEATKLIKKINTSIPVIVLTAFAYSDDRVRAKEAGCDGFLTKPVNYKELKEVIKVHLDL